MFARLRLGAHAVFGRVGAGLPQPGELYREEQADGMILIRQHAPAEIAKNTPKNKFICE